MTVTHDAVVLRPGMKVLFRVDPDTDLEQLQEFRDQLSVEMPGVGVVVVACNQIAIYDPEEA